MWACFNNAFVSAVQDKNKKDGLVIRARRRDHLEKLFPEDKVIVNGGTDYKYRVYVSKEKYAELVKNAILGIDYGNFKNSVRDDDLHDLYNGFWYMHYKMQR